MTFRLLSSPSLSPLPSNYLVPNKEKLPKKIEDSALAVFLDP